MAIDQGNYPEMMGKAVIINAPGMFKLVWGIVKRFLDARTLSKIEASANGCCSSNTPYYLPSDFSLAQWQIDRWRCHPFYNARIAELG